MLFDLEDYRYYRESFTVGNGIPYDSKVEEILNAGYDFPIELARRSCISAKETFYAYRKAIEEVYFISSGRQYEHDKFIDLQNIYLEFNDYCLEYASKFYNFWCAYLSFSFYHSEQLSEGDSLPYISGDGDLSFESYVFKIMTQEIYDEYYTVLQNIMGKSKEILEFEDVIQ
jgi:hypothetical protein